MTDTLQDAMTTIAKELAVKGIGKDRRNQQQGYNFRGIDDMLNAVGPIMARHGVFMTPSFEVLSHKDIERQTRNGATSWTQVLLRGTFRFYRGAETVEAVTIGEALDNADKASNKAMSNALKYALINTFMIPVVGADDADLHLTNVADDNFAASVKFQPIDTVPWFNDLLDAKTQADVKAIWNKFLDEHRETQDVDGRSKVKAEVIRRGKELGDAID